MNRNEGNTPQDALYADYVTFFEQFDCTLIFIPNASKRIESYFESLPIRGIIFSGGNDVSADFARQEAVDIRNPALLRDFKEKKLLDIAITRRLSVFGICRGMQFINCYFGGTLTQALSRDKSKDMHVAKRHTITICDQKAVEFFEKDTIEVNSYHHQGVKRDQISPKLEILAVSSKDDVVEALFHPQLPIAGIQWHPERKGSSFVDDNKFVGAFIKKELYWKEE